MNQKYSLALFGCMFISGVILAIGTAGSWPALIMMIAALLPLICYHLYLRSLSRTAIPQAAIDSVYYFGFLLTIAALAASAIRLSLAQELNNISDVGFQFGLGLLATGYAVFARLELTMSAQVEHSLAPEDAMNRIVENSRELSTNVELATRQFDEYVKAQAIRISEAQHASTSRVESTIVDATRSFHEAMSATSHEALESFMKIRDVLTDDSLVVERTRFVATMRTSSAALEQLTGRSNELMTAMTGCFNVTNATAQNFEALGAHVTALQANLLIVGGAGEALKASMESLRRGTDDLSETTSLLQPALIELRDIGSALNGVQPTMKNLKAATKRATDQIAALATATDSFGEIAESFGETVRKTGELASSLLSIVGVWDPLKSETEIMARNLANAARASTELSQSLEGLSSTRTDIKAVSDEAHNALGEFVSLSRGALTSLSDVSGQLRQENVTIDSMKDLRRDTEHLQHAVAGILESVRGFSELVRTLQEDIKNSTQAMKLSVQDSAEALRRDVAQSTEATRILSSSFMKIADNVIEHTRPAGTRQ